MAAGAGGAVHHDAAGLPAGSGVVAWRLPTAAGDAGGMSGSKRGGGTERENNLPSHLATRRRREQQGIFADEIPV